MSRVIHRALCVALVMLVSVSANELSAQAFKESFGKNRIQYKFFDWNFYSSENFEVNYYGQSENLAYRTIEYLEAEFSRITETLGYHPFSKTRVFLYNSILDKQQSNIGVQGRDFTIGGQTNFVQAQLEVAYTGDYSTFKEKLVFAVTDMLTQDMLYGGNIAEMFQSSFTSPIPIWFTGGASNYVARGWSKESDDAVREFISHNPQNKFSKLSNQQAILIGQSIWNFISQRYGQRSISNILNLARIIRNEESSIERTLGISFEDFMVQWRTFYGRSSELLEQDYLLPNRDYVITGKNRKEETYSDLTFNNTGSLLAYAGQNDGRFHVDVANVSSGKTTTIYKAGLRLIDQEIDLSAPLLSWADSTTLGIVYQENGSNILVVKRLGQKGEQKIVIPLLDNIQSFDFKYGGRQAVMTGSLNGISDAFIYNLVRGQVRRITNDHFDDRDISFLAGTNQVVFSSNRATDSVFVSGPTDLESVDGNQFNLFTYDLDYPDSAFGRITNDLATNILAQAPNNRDLYFLSDQQGIGNVYRYSQTDSTSTQFTSFVFGIKDYAIDAQNNRIAFINYALGLEAIYLQNFSNLNAKFTPVTQRRALEVKKILADRREARILSNPASLDSIKNLTRPELVVPKEQKLDSLPEGAINTDEYVFDQKAKVDTRDYQFEKPTEDKALSNSSFLSIYQNASSEEKIQGPAPYENRFQTNNVVTTFVIDELRSFAQLMEIQMNDYLENHRFKGGILVPLSFNQGYDVYGEYEYLKNRIDLKVRYSKKSIVTIDRATFLDQRYNLDKFELGFSYPFSAKLRAYVNPFYTQTRFLDRDFRLLIPTNNPSQFNEQSDFTASYIGGSAGLVYDNSVVRGTNLHEGTRAKVTLDSYLKMNANAASFNNLQVDIRHYQKLNKGVYLAARVFYGSYFGDAPKRYLLGGVDNWAFNSTESSNDENNPLLFQTLLNNSDILFHQFTNLRGYNYNTFNGRNILTFSGEIRFPINQLLQKGDLKSNFLRNLQIIGFYDIGSAWDDLSPFAERNNQNIEEIVSEGSPFSAVINNFSNPWLQSTGVGVRTMLFGFFSRLDFAFPVRNFEVLSPKFQLSFGYDF